MHSWPQSRPKARARGAVTPQEENPRSAGHRQGPQPNAAGSRCGMRAAPRPRRTWGVRVPQTLPAVKAPGISNLRPGREGSVTPRRKQSAWEGGPSRKSPVVPSARPARQAGAGGGEPRGCEVAAEGAACWMCGCACGVRRAECVCVCVRVCFSSHASRDTCGTRQQRWTELAGSCPRPCSLAGGLRRGLPVCPPLSEPRLSPS